MADLYSPHQDFATPLPAGMGEGYMQFERIALPRNPNNDVDDVCYENGKCSFPLSPLLKMGNPKFLKQFTEMYSFLLDFQMSTTDVNDIIAYFGESQEFTELTKHEQWMNASCKWLKDTADTTEQWYQEITRYDCIFKDLNKSNCGFNFYFDSLTDARLGNKVSKEWYESVAGNCKNSSVVPEYDCYSDMFVGETCRDSCQGIIGPILGYDSGVKDGFNNESIVRVGNYTFLLCSGHGICNIRQKICNCDAGFGGEGCEIEFTVFTYATGLIAFWGLLFFGCIIVLFNSIWWVYINKSFVAKLDNIVHSGPALSMFWDYFIFVPSFERLPLYL